VFTDYWCETVIGLPVSESPGINQALKEYMN